MLEILIYHLYLYSRGFHNRCGGSTLSHFASFEHRASVDVVGRQNPQRRPFRGNRAIGAVQGSVAATGEPGEAAVEARHGCQRQGD